MGERDKMKKKRNRNMHLLWRHMAHTHTHIHPTYSTTQYIRTNFYFIALVPHTHTHIDSHTIYAPYYDCSLFVSPISNGQQTMNAALCILTLYALMFGIFRSLFLLLIHHFEFFPLRSVIFLSLFLSQHNYMSQFM